LHLKQQEGTQKNSQPIVDGQAQIDGLHGVALRNGEPSIV
jgi:hypothetical protein